MSLIYPLTHRIRLPVHPWLLVGFGGVIVGSWLLFRQNFFLPFFTVTNIVCHTQYGNCLPSVEQAFHSFEKENLVVLNRQEVRQTALSLTGVQEVIARKQFPATLDIRLQVAKPVVALDLTDGVGDRGLFVLLDRTGQPLAQTTITALPKLSVDTPLEQANREHVRWASEVLVQLGSMGYNPRGRLSKEVLSVTIDNVKLQIPFDKDSRVVAGSLQLMLNRFTIEGKQPRSIDLRFKNPVVTF